MRTLRCLVLLLPALAFVAATCVTSTTQRGPAGPWVGEVTNTGDTTATSSYVEAHVFDADGNEVLVTQVVTCPYTLAPGERGTFEYFFPTDLPSLQPKLPLRAEFRTLSSPGDDSRSRGEGLAVREVSRDPARRYALVEVRNESPFTYSNILICANLRTPAGQLAEVGSSLSYRQPLPNVMRPGDARTFPIFFNSMPEGTLDFVARGDQFCCYGVIPLDPAPVRITATRVTGSGANRTLFVLGEWRNTTDQDLEAAAMTAEVESSPADRVDATPAACGGQVLHDGTATMLLAIPIAAGIANPKPLITGVQAMSGFGLYAPPVQVLSSSPVAATSAYGLPGADVHVRISNPTTTWLSVDSVCADLRDADGRLVGTGAGPDHRVLAPGASVEVVVEADALGAYTMTQAHPIARAADPVPPPIPVGY